MIKGKVYVVYRIRERQSVWDGGGGGESYMWGDKVKVDIGLSGL